MYFEKMVRKSGYFNTKQKKKEVNIKKKGWLENFAQYCFADFKNILKSCVDFKKLGDI